MERKSTYHSKTRMLRASYLLRIKTSFKNTTVNLRSIVGTENKSNMINSGPIVVLGLSSKNSNTLSIRSTNISDEDDV